jgi:hypothetical protein
MFTYILYDSLVIFALTVNGAENIILSKVQGCYVIMSLPFSALSLTCHVSNARNKVKLKAYQLEYAWQKWPLGIERLERQSRNYWRISTCISVSS